MTDTQTTQSLSLRAEVGGGLHAAARDLLAIVDVVDERLGASLPVDDGEWDGPRERLRTALSAPAVEGGEAPRGDAWVYDFICGLESGPPRREDPRDIARALRQCMDNNKPRATQSPAPTDGRLVFSHCPACARDDNGTGPDDAGVSCSASGPTDGCEAVWIKRPTDGVEEAVGRLTNDAAFLEEGHAAAIRPHREICQDLRLLLASRKGGGAG